MRIAVLTPRGKNEPHVIEILAETESTFHGTPRNNSFCPALEYPKFAWEVSNVYTYCPYCGLVEIQHICIHVP